MSNLPRSRPSEQGVDPQAVLDLVDALDRSDHEPHSLMVLRHGHVVAEGWWAPYRAETPHLLYSLSKSFTSAAVGLAIEEGLVGLDDTLVSHLPEQAPDDVNERVAAMTVRHALTMSTGHDTDPIFSLFGWIIENPDGDWLEPFFELVPEHQPGSPFTYNQLATYSLARIVATRSGQRLLDYLGPRLFDPLGIEPAGWLGTGGHDFGFAGLFLRTEEIARFGQLCLQHGAWEGRQVLPAEWVAEATRLQVPNDASNRGANDINLEPDWNSGYGYQFWMCRHGYRGDGALGQFCIVWPDEDVVIVTTASAPDMQGLLNLIEEHLGDAFDDPSRLGEPATEERRSNRVDAIEDQILERTAALTIAPTADHGDGTISGDFSRADAGAAPTLRGVSLHPVGGGWTLELDHVSGRTTIPVGRGRWLDGTWPPARDRTGLAVSSSAGSIDDDRFLVDIVFTETPHRLALTLDVRAKSFTAAWNQHPLHGADPADLAILA